MEEGELQSVKGQTDAYGEYGGVDWRPYFPMKERAIGIIAQEAVTKEQFFYEAPNLQENLISIIQEAKQKNVIVIIIVDPWTLSLNNYSHIMSDYDKLDSFNCCAMTLLNFEDKETNLKNIELSKLINKTFINKIMNKKSEQLREKIISEEELIDEIIDALQRIRQKIIEASNIINTVEGEGPRILPTL